MDNKWHLRFYQVANLVATWSKDPEAKVGAVVVSPDKSQFISGYNGLPRGLQDTAERYERKEVKLQLIEHAEINAMDNAQQSIRGWSLYVTKPCCHRCALAIIRKGIKEVFMPAPEEDSSWFTKQQLAMALLTEAGVVIHYIKVIPNE